MAEFQACIESVIINQQVAGGWRMRIVDFDYLHLPGARHKRTGGWVLAVHTPARYPYLPNTVNILLAVVIPAWRKKHL